MSENSDSFSLDVVEFLNTEFGNDFNKLKNLQEVVDRINNYERELESQVLN